jgi:hypothetical protein
MKISHCLFLKNKIETNEFSKLEVNALNEA